MNPDCLANLKQLLAGLKCAHGHQLHIKFVNTKQSAPKKFLCDDCVRKERRAGSRELVDLGLYLDKANKAALASRDREEPLERETASALGVTANLKKDYSDSLQGVQDTVLKHYDELIDRITKSAQKTKKILTERIQSEKKRSIRELESIENRLTLFASRTPEQIVASVLEQASKQALARGLADNSLFEQLRHLNVKESMKHTHIRLAKFGQKYFQKKAKCMSGLNDFLKKRFQRDRDHFEGATKSGERIISSISRYLDQSQDGKKDEELSQDSSIGRRKFKNTLKHALRCFGDSPAEEQALGKRDAKVEADYDPKLSLEQALVVRQVEKKKTSYESFSLFEVPSAIKKKNRLQSLLQKSRETGKRRPTQKRPALQLEEHKALFKPRSSNIPAYEPRKQLKADKDASYNTLFGSLTLFNHDLPAARAERPPFGPADGRPRFGEGQAEKPYVDLIRLLQTPASDELAEKLLRPKPAEKENCLLQRLNKSDPRLKQLEEKERRLSQKQIPAPAQSQRAVNMM